MSKNRNERWFEVSPTRFNHLHGYVELNSFGLWNAIVVYKQRQPLRKNQPPVSRPWQRAVKHCGEHKRARNAMMAVEDAVKKMQAEKNEHQLL
jgi:hypothetical protein